MSTTEQLFAGLGYFLRQFVKYWFGEERPEGHAQSIAALFNEVDRSVLAPQPLPLLSLFHRLHENDF